MITDLNECYNHRVDPYARQKKNDNYFYFFLDKSLSSFFLASNQLCSLNILVTPRDRPLQSPEILVRKKQMTYFPLLFPGQYCGPSAWCNIIALSHKIWRFIGVTLPWRDECRGEKTGILNEARYSLPFPPTPPPLPASNGLYDYISYCSRNLTLTNDSTIL